MTYPSVDVLLPVRITDGRWQVPMTMHAAACMRLCTAVPFRFVVVERTDNGKSNITELLPRLGDNAVHIQTGADQGGTLLDELNTGLAACAAEYVVHTGNDVFVRPGWLEAMLACFKIPDCGVATLASSDLPKPYGTRMDVILEGVYGPHMMFRRELVRGWHGYYNFPSANLFPTGTAVRFDTPTYTDIFGDTDLVVAHYVAGMRAYRNHGVVIDHLNKATFSAVYNKEQMDSKFKAGHEAFMRKYGPMLGHLRMYHHLADGTIV